MLAWTIYISFIGAAVLPFLRPRHKAAARTVALAVALAGLGIGVFSVAHYKMDSGLQTIVDIPWVAGMGIHYYLAADGISLTLVLLTGLASVAGILFSWNVEHRVPEFFSLYLALIGAVAAYETLWRSAQLPAAGLPLVAVALIAVLVMGNAVSRAAQRRIYD